MTRSIKTISAALLLSGVLSFLPGHMSMAGNGQQLVLGVDKAKLHRLEQPASTVIIGNPSIADVNIQDGRLLIFTGKNFGTTNVIILDEKDQEIVAFDVSVSSSDVGRMTVYKGASKSSYNCSPVCENSLSVGDNKDDFDLVRRQMESKMTISKGEGSASLDGSDQ